MMVPGSNLLAMASRLIGFQTIQHSRFKRCVLGNDGVWTPEYFQAVECQASVQPTPRNMYEQLGLDLQKYYVTIYSLASLRLYDLERGRFCDIVDFNGDRFNVESNTPWENQDGWRASVCCKIGATPV